MSNQNNVDFLLLEQDYKNTKISCKNNFENMEVQLKNMKDEIKELKAHNNKSLWFTISTLIGIVITLFTVIFKS